MRESDKSSHSRNMKVLGVAAYRRAGHEDVVDNTPAPLDHISA